MSIVSVGVKETDPSCRSGTSIKFATKMRLLLDFTFWLLELYSGVS